MRSGLKTIEDHNAEKETIFSAQIVILTCVYLDFNDFMVNLTPQIFNMENNMSIQLIYN